jgi:hypothetical protein
MKKWLLDQNAWDSAGELDAKAAWWIARKAKSWMLTTLPTDFFDHALDDKSHAAPGQPIVAHVGKDGWEVLDGQHRVSQAIRDGVASLPAYIPVEDKDEAHLSPAVAPGTKPSNIKQGTAHQSPKLPKLAAPPVQPQKQPAA